MMMMMMMMMMKKLIKLQTGAYKITNNVQK